MAIFKAVVQHEYAQIPNKTLQDSSISFEARGLLAMLLSMPEDWEVNKSWAINQSKAGKDKVNRIFSELINAGYIRKCESQRQRGRFTPEDYFVFPEPGRICRDGKTDDGKTDDGKTASTKETETKETETKETFINCERCNDTGLVDEDKVAIPCSCQEQKPKKKTRGCQIPDDWQPNDKHLQLSHEKGVIMADIVDQFRDHHKAKGSVMKDWDAAFRTWIRNASKFQSKGQPQQRSLTPHQGKW